MPGDFYETLGARVRRVREMRGWTQEQLAASIGVAPPTLSRYETGRKSITLEILRRVAIRAEVSLIQLLDIGKPLESVGQLPPLVERALPPNRDEGDLVKRWRELSSRDRKLALSIVKLMLTRR